MGYVPRRPAPRAIRRCRTTTGTVYVVREPRFAPSRRNGVRSWLSLSLSVILCLVVVSSCTSDPPDRATSNTTTSITASSTTRDVTIPLDLDSVTGPWFDRDGEPVPATGPSLLLRVGQGPGHCDWEQALFLNLAVPLGTPTRDFASVEQYIRDPMSVIPRSGLGQELDEDAELPSDAEFTGFTSSSGIELWVDPSHDSVFLSAGQTTERWPRADPPVMCD